MYEAPDTEDFDGYTLRHVRDSTWHLFRRELQTGEIQGVGFNPAHELTKRWPEIREALRGVKLGLLHLPFCDRLGVDRIDSTVLEDVKYALISDFSGPAEFSSSTLHTLRLRCSPKTTFVHLPALRNLYITAATEAHLEAVVRAAPHIERLEIVDSRLTSIAPVAALTRVKHCELSYLTRLESIAPLKAYARLTWLTVEKSKRIADLGAVIPSLTALETLRIFGMGDIGNADYICDLQRLKELKILGTKLVKSDRLMKMKTRVPTCLFSYTH